MECLNTTALARVANGTWEPNAIISCILNSAEPCAAFKDLKNTLIPIGITIGMIWITSLLFAVLFSFIHASTHCCYCGDNVYIPRSNTDEISNNFSLETGAENIRRKKESRWDAIKGLLLKCGTVREDIPGDTSETNIERLTRLKKQIAKGHCMDMPDETSLSISPSDFVQRLNPVNYNNAFWVHEQLEAIKDRTLAVRNGTAIAEQGSVNLTLSDWEFLIERSFDRPAAGRVLEALMLGNLPSKTKTVEATEGVMLEGHVGQQRAAVGQSVLPADDFVHNEQITWP